MAPSCFREPTSFNYGEMENNGTQNFRGHSCKADHGESLGVMPNSSPNDANA